MKYIQQTLILGILVTNAVATAGAIPADYDGDGRDDPVVWRPREGNWYILRSGGVCRSPASPFWIGCIRQWGLPGDVPFAGDFSGDGRAGYCVYRPHEASFYVLSSNGSAFYRIQVGRVGDEPVPADYDGDGRTDLAVYRASENRWIIRQTHDLRIRNLWFRPATNPAVDAIFLAPADYDNDGMADPAFVIKSRHSYNWQYRSSRTGQRQYFGVAGDDDGRPVTADIDGDGRSDAVVWDEVTGYWTFFENRGPGSPLPRELQWGLAGDRATAADFDGDGRDDFAVWRPSNGTWYILTSSGRPSAHAVRHGNGWAIQWGLSGDEPMPHQP